MWKWWCQWPTVYSTFGPTGAGSAGTANWKNIWNYPISFQQTVYVLSIGFVADGLFNLIKGVYNDRCEFNNDLSMSKFYPVAQSGCFAIGY